jgi:hypothetical protein
MRRPGPRKRHFPCDEKKIRGQPDVRDTAFLQDADKWAAEIKRDGRQIRLGIYNSIEEAAQSYDRAALEFQGDRARLNFPAMLEQYEKEREVG